MKILEAARQWRTRHPKQREQPVQRLRGIKCRTRLENCRKLSVSVRWAENQRRNGSRSAGSRSWRTQRVWTESQKSWSSRSNSPVPLRSFMCLWTGTSPSGMCGDWSPPYLLSGLTLGSNSRRDVKVPAGLLYQRRQFINQPHHSLHWWNRSKWGESHFCFVTSVRVRLCFIRGSPPHDTYRHRENNSSLLLILF